MKKRLFISSILMTLVLLVAITTATFAWYQATAATQLSTATGSFTTVQAAKPDDITVSLTNVSVSVSYTEVDFKGRAFGSEGAEAAAKDLIPSEYGVLSSNTVSVGGSGNAWHHAYLMGDGTTYKWDDQATGITWSNYQNYKVYKVEATVAAMSADQFNSFVGSHSATITYSANGANAGFWTDSNPNFTDLTGYTAYGDGTTLTITVNKADLAVNTAKTYLVGYVFVYAHGASITNNSDTAAKTVGVTPSYGSFN